MKNVSGNRTNIVIARSNAIPDLMGLPEASVAYCPEKGEDFQFIADALKRKYIVKDELGEDARMEVSFGRKQTPLPLVKVIKTVDVIGESADEYLHSADCNLALLDVISCKEDELASAYGSVASKLVRLTDYRVKAITLGEKADEPTVRFIRKTIAEYISKTPTFSSTIALCKSLSAGLDELGVEGGEEQMARAIALLFRRESRKKIPFGISSLVCANVVNAVYKHYLVRNLTLLFPPDNNLRIDQAVEFLGLDERDLIKTVLPLTSWIKQEVTEKKLRAHRGELLAEICYHELLLKRAMGQMKRLISDGGYELDKSIDKADLSIAFALAPDLSTRSRHTLMGVMKDKGALDAFLL